MQVITDETFSRHEGFDLASFDEKKWPPSELPTFRVPKTETYNAFKARIAQHFNYPDNQIRLWVLVNRQNGTVRPNTRIPENDPTLSASCYTHTRSDFLPSMQRSMSFGMTWLQDRQTFAYTWM